MAELFQKDRTVISWHIRNVFNEGELEEQSTCAKFAHMGHGSPSTAWRCRPGEFHVWIAPNAAEGTPAKFILQD